MNSLRIYSVGEYIALHLPVDRMGLNLVLDRLVVGHPHVAGIGSAVAVARHVARTVEAVDMSCIDCSVRLDVVDAAVAVPVVAAAIVAAIPTAGDNSH